MMKTIFKYFPPALFLTLAAPAFAQTICVFDPSGANGDAYFFMKDYAVTSKQWGADVTLKPYTDEQKATDAFKSGKCDGLFATGIRIRQFNNFTGSIDNVGQIPNTDVAKTIISLIANPKLAPDMINGDTEIVGVSPLGAAYPIAADRTVNTMAKIFGKRFAVLDYDPAQNEIVQKIGAVPVTVSLSSIASKFNSGQLDMVDLPIYAYKALDFSKGMSKGGIGRYTIAFLTTQLIIHQEKFPEGYGQKSRTWFAGQLNRQFQSIKRLEDSVAPNEWVDLRDADKLGYDKLLREARLSLIHQGIYNKRMANITKKARCLKIPSGFDCGMGEE
ncbi:MAG: hypothetical protein KGO49_00350 [Gammaproteobacteria bacterium]|nr:hypothetical protein [Gammaproteobacteria bacterium]